jgi:hypothetical protein
MAQVKLLSSFFRWLFNDDIVSRLYGVGWHMNDYKFLNSLKGSDRGLTEVLFRFRHLPEGTQENHDNDL